MGDEQLIPKSNFSAGYFIRDYEKGDLREQQLTIVHFNDVYEVEEQKKEPIGGATRFATAVKKFDNPLVLFSGDCFAPSLLSTFTKGEHMLPVLKSINTACACIGNHDLDFGVDVLSDLVSKMDFPWLMSNVIDNENGQPLGGGKISHIIEHSGIKIGLMGLVEWEWLETLSTIDPECVTYRDYVEVGTELAQELINQGCQFIIALTHMRFPNDMNLAENAKGIDLILGGHDHIYDVKKARGIPVVKSGSDFRDFSVITVTWGTFNVPQCKIDRISITADYEEDVELKGELQKYLGMMESKLDDVIGEFQVDLDATFSKIRTGECNLGNFLCDIMLACTNSDAALLNSGTMRSDRIHSKGVFTMRDLLTVLPMMDSLVVLRVSGSQIIEALENGVSQYPKLEGRFPQVSGIRFAFDPSKPPGNRIDAKYVKIGDEYIHPHQYYRLVTKKYIGTGHDGYTTLANAEILCDEDETLELSIAVQNHFRSVSMVNSGKKFSRHHQSLVTLSRRHSLIRSMSTLSVHEQTPPLERGCSLSPRPSLTKQSGNILDDIEKLSCKLAPQIEGRIIKILNKETLAELHLERKFWEDNLAIMEEDENSPTTPTDRSLGMSAKQI